MAMNSSFAWSAARNSDNWFVLLGVTFELPDPDQTRHIFDRMQNERDAVVHEHRKVHRTPISLLELSTLGLRTPHVVLLNRHRVRSARAQHGLQRRTQIARAGRMRIIGIVGKDVEQIASHDCFAHGVCRTKIRVGTRDRVRGTHRARRETEGESRACPW